MDWHTIHGEAFIDNTVNSPPGHEVLDGVIGSAGDNVDWIAVAGIDFV